MEKKQVSTFLKILQIPKDAPPADIKESLLSSGWNEQDADEAVRVIYPNYSADTPSSAEPSSREPQLVAQRYVKQATEPETSKATSQVSEQSFVPEPASPTPTEAPGSEEIVTPDEATSSSIPPATSVPDSASARTEDSFDYAKVTKEHVAAVEKTVSPQETPSPEEEAVAEQARPHTDAPWLENQVDIYNVTEEEKQEMIRTVYRTNERLTPQTIHALLGIDVDLSEYEAAYKQRKQSEVSVVQIAVILLSSLAIAAIALYLGLYYFEVGPFHPSITGGR